MEIIVFIVGLFFSAIGGYLVWDGYRFRKTALETTGQVIGYAVKQSKSRKSGSQETYAPVIEYTYKGETHQFTGMLSSTQVKYKIGEAAPILVASHDPSKARLKGPGLIIFGTVFFTIGVGSIVFFFHIFKASKFSIAVAAFVILVLLAKLIKALHKHNIYSIDDAKAAITKLKEMKAGASSKGKEQEYIITDPVTFKKVRGKNKIPAWLAALFFIIGVGVCTGGVYWAPKRADFLETALTSSGVVIGFNSKTSTSDGKTTTTYYPRVRFTPNGGLDEILFEHDLGSSHPSYHRGEIVKVLYSPYDPNDAIIDAGWMNWFGPILMLSIGGLFMLFGSSILWKRLKERNQREEIRLEI